MWGRRGKSLGCLLCVWTWTSVANTARRKRRGEKGMLGASRGLKRILISVVWGLAVRVCAVSPANWKTF